MKNCRKWEALKERLRQAETFLWQGQIESVELLFQKECPKRAQKFLGYLHKHRDRLINYRQLQEDYQVSIGSGAVESAVKQIGRRLKLSGAQWRPSSVNAMLRLRCAYLNGLLAVS